MSPVGDLPLKRRKMMKYDIGIKSYSDFQKMLNQWLTTNYEFQLMKVELDKEKKEVHYILLKKGNKIDSKK
jgi:hypothetical protein